MKYSEIDDPAVTKSQQEWISGRWGNLVDRYRHHGEEFARYLFLVNAGGAIATLGFMGAMKNLDPLPGARIILALFLVGVVFLGLARAATTFQMWKSFTGFRDSVNAYYGDELDWPTFIKRDQEASRYRITNDLLYGSSFVCFVTGLIAGYVGLLGS